MENRNYFLLHELVAEGKNEELRSALESNPKTKQLLEIKDSVGFTPLLIAAAKGNQAAASILIENGASIKVSSGVGNTLLMYAVKVGGSEQTIALLLEQYPDCLNLMNQNGDTAIMFASVAGNLSAIRQMMAAGARVDTANREGITPFHCAKNAAVVEALASAFASNKEHLTQVVNVANVYGRTALFSAAEQNDASRAELLIKLGAEVSKRDKSGKNVLSIVSDKKSEVYKVLQAAFKAEQDKADRLAQQLLFQDEPKSAPPQQQKQKSQFQPKRPQNVVNPSNQPEETISETVPTTSEQLENKQKESIQSVSTEGDDSGPWQTVGAKKSKPQTKKTNQNQPKKSAAVSKSPNAAQIQHKVPPSPQKAVKPGDQELQEMIRALERQYPHAEDLDLHPANLCGIGLESLSMAQLSALEEIHRQQLIVLGDAKVAEAKRQERIRLEEENKIEQEIQELRRRV